MQQVRKAIALSTLALMLAGSPIFAQDHHDDAKHDDAKHSSHHDKQNQDPHHFVRHDDWKQGTRMKSDDWSRAVHVDYVHYRLAPPRPGYEWREVDGNFVMAAVATGIIAAVVAESLAH